MACGLCAAITSPINRGDFRAGGGVDLLDDLGKLGAGAVYFLVNERLIDFGNQDGVGGKKYAWLERLEPELRLRMCPSRARRTTA